MYFDALLHYIPHLSFVTYQNFTERIGLGDLCNFRLHNAHAACCEADSMEGYF